MGESAQWSKPQDWEAKKEEQRVRVPQFPLRTYCSNLPSYTRYHFPMFPPLSKLPTWGSSCSTWAFGEIFQIQVISSSSDSIKHSYMILVEKEKRQFNILNNNNRKKYGKIFNRMVGAELHLYSYYRKWPNKKM